MVKGRAKTDPAATGICVKLCYGNVMGLNFPFGRVSKLTYFVCVCLCHQHLEIKSGQMECDGPGQVNVLLGRPVRARLLSHAVH